MKSRKNVFQENNHDPVEEAITTLFEELQLATRWRRPSILLVTYSSKLLMIEAQIFLEKKLRNIKQMVTLVNIDEENYDIPLKLSQIPKIQNKIFFVSGLNQGGGKTGHNAYKALNIRRELLVEHDIRTVFWLNKEEADELPRQALDFWSFRHRMVELSGQPTPERIAEITRDLNWPYWNLQELSKEIPTGLAFRKELLAEIPEWTQAPFIRAELLLGLSGLHWAKGDYLQAQIVLKKGLEIAQKNSSVVLQSRYWNAIGLIHESLCETEQAIIAFQKSLKLDPESANAWGNLGTVFRVQHLQADALAATNKSIELDPTIPFPWNNLGRLYFDSGQFEQAIQAFEKSIAIYKNDPQIWLKLGETLRLIGRPADAVQPLLKAKELNAKDGSTWYNLGLAYRELGLINKAIRAFYKSARLNPLKTDPWKILGDIYRTNNQLRYARKAYKSARSINPNDKLIKYSLEACYLRRKKMDS